VEALTITHGEIMEALAAAQRDAPDDAVTVTELVEATGLHRNRVLAALKAIHAKGQLRAHRKWIDGIDGRRTHVPAYTLVASPKKRRG
jgi:hypothetical protein